ncbi:hypothetical protein PIN31009_05543 [Pandoraea iniqua]|uniref:packaged DNA stabilization protein n=1 Tax=Pandoraea iniqua TaxID=2508288 RepID=UPI00124058A2|nr:packaged DNA stabilization protein [Pandoraea iniqua]VVE59460.1 hypothetical protein PIN31009_05543 [Pandoraea iniqua]
MQIPLSDGTYADIGADFRTSYPRNLVPVFKDTGISKMYLRTAEGITRFDVNAPVIYGACRGAVNWNGTCYRVLGPNLVSVSSTGLVTVLGELKNDNLPVSIVHGYDNQGIGIVSAGKLYFYTIQKPDGTTTSTPTLQECTNQNVGTPTDVTWMAGYFVLSDDTAIYVTDLDNQFNINSQKFGSDSNSPDKLNGTLRFRNELYGCNRYTIAVFDNQGGTGFPFVQNVGATIQKGVLGPHGKCLTSQGFAFLGSAEDEAPSVYLSAGLGLATSIASREVQTVIGQYTDEQLSKATLEYRGEKVQQFIYLHLPDYTWVYDVMGSQAAQKPIWFMLDSSVDGSGPWRAWHPVYCYGKFLMGDKIDQRVGYIDPLTAQQYGERARWQFDVAFMYNGGKGVIVNAVELIGTLGYADLKENPTVSMRYTLDGRKWSVDRYISFGRQGQTDKRAQWRPAFSFKNFCGFRFSGFNAAPVSMAALEVDPEPLSV